MIAPVCWTFWMISHTVHTLQTVQSAKYYLIESGVVELSWNIPMILLRIVNDAKQF